jgi:hypothetical protein
MMGFKSRASTACNAILRPFRALANALDRVFHPLQYKQKRRNEANHKFLVNLGFSEIDDGHLSYVDGDGNSLRLIQTTDRMLTFIVVGRRRSRAYIKLDGKGRYVSYTGPLKV